MNSKLTQLYTKGDDKNSPRSLTQVELQRRVNLMMLIDKAGGQTPLAKRLGTANTSYLSQQTSTTPHRVINEKSARKLEGVLGLEPGWMDHHQTHIIYASKPKSSVTELPHHEHVIREELTKYETVLVTSTVDTQRLEECLTIVLPKAKGLPPKTLSKVICALYSSVAHGDALVTMADTLISFAHTS